MTTTEALRLQLDILQREKQELEVRNLKLTDNPSRESLKEVEKERDHWKDECERQIVENEQLKTLYEELLQQLPEGQTNPVNSSTGHQATAELQELIKRQNNDLEQWKYKCQEMEKQLNSVSHWKTRSELLEKELNKLQKLNGELERKVLLAEDKLELECYRAEAKVRRQWEACEGRLVEQLAELQCRLKSKEAGRGPWQTSKRDVLVEGFHNTSALSSTNVSTTKQPVCTSSPSITRAQWQVSDYSGQQQSVQSGGMVSDILQTCNPSTQSSETPVLYTGPVCSLPLLPGITQPVISSSNAAVRDIDPVTSVLLAQQLPPLPKFSGEGNDGELGVDTFEDWLERFELMASALSWSSQAKLVNLITRLHGQAYSFFRSCTMEQRTNYCLLVAELRKWFTPVRLPAIQSSLFHDRRQHASESVDHYAQELRTLFHRAYPSVYQGTREAEALGQTVLVNQFVVGLLPEIKSKIVGCESKFDQLLTKARFEEAKLRDLDSAQSASSLSPVTRTVRPDPKPAFVPRPQSFSGTRSNMGPRCYNCGSPSHLIRQCPYQVKGKYSETPGKTNNGIGKAGSEGRNNIGNADNNTVSSITPSGESNTSEGKSMENISSELNKVTVTMHNISSNSVTEGIQLGPTLTGLVEVEGVALEALLDTGSPVTIIQLEALLQILAEQRSPNQTSIEWRAAVETRLEPTTVVLRNYSGDRLQVVRQIQVTVSRLEYSTNALIQVQRGAPAKLLIGTDLLSKLGYLFVQASQTGNDNDMLNDDVSVSDNDSKVDVVPQEIQQDVEGADVIKSINLESEILAEVPLQTVEDNKTELNSGAVCLIQATRIPARHQKLVRAEVKDICFDRQLVTMFEPNIVELEGSFLSAQKRWFVLTVISVLSFWRTMDVNQYI